MPISGLPQFHSIGGGWDKVLPQGQAIYNTEDYAPQQWQEWQSSVQPGGPQHAKHQEFIRRVEPVLQRRFKEFAAAWSGGWRPEGYVDDPVRNRLSVQQVFDIFRGTLPPAEQSPDARKWANRFLDYMKSHSLGGSDAQNPVTPEQLQEWQTPSSVPDVSNLSEVPGAAAGVLKQLRDNMNAKYRLTDAGRGNLERLIDYNLLTTFQTDRTHRPDFLQSGPSLGVMQNLVGMAYPSSAVSGMPAQQLGNVWDADPASALDNAIMWDDYSRQKFAENPYYWNDFLTGGTVPQASALSSTGLNRKTGGGDSALGQATRWLSGPMLFPNLTGFTDEERQNLHEFMGNEDRFTQIRPEGLTDGEHAGRTTLKNNIADAEAQSWDSVSTLFPEAVRGFNKTFGTNITPFYPSRFVNDLGMVVPAMVGDPQNVAQTAVSALGGPLALGASLLGQLAEIPAEGGFNTAMSLSNTPQSWGDYFTKPDTQIPLRTPSGRIPEPDLPEYEEALRSYRQSQKKALGMAGSVLQHDKQQAPKRQKPSFMESEVFLQPY
jgi:hypothetical protein